jgi:hypothetical protein
MDNTDIIINRKVIKEASRKFLSSVESLTRDPELLEATIEDLTSIMVKALLSSIESEDPETKEAKPQKKEEHPEQEVPPQEVDYVMSERLRSSFLSKLQERVKPK